MNFERTRHHTDDHANGATPVVVDPKRAWPLSELSRECFLARTEAAISVIGNSIGASLNGKAGTLHYHFSWGDTGFEDEDNCGYGALALCNGRERWSLYISVSDGGLFLFEGHNVRFEKLNIENVDAAVWEALADDALVALCGDPKFKSRSRRSRF